VRAQVTHGVWTLTALHAGGKQQQQQQHSAAVGSHSNDIVCSQERCIAAVSHPYPYRNASGCGQPTGVAAGCQAATIAWQPGAATPSEEQWPRAHASSTLVCRPGKGACTGWQECRQRIGGQHGAPALAQRPAAAALQPARAGPARPPAPLRRRPRRVRRLRLPQQPRPRAPQHRCARAGCAPGLPAGQGQGRMVRMRVRARTRTQVPRGSSGDQTGCARHGVKHKKSIWPLIACKRLFAGAQSLPATVMGRRRLGSSADTRHHCCAHARSLKACPAGTLSASTAADMGSRLWTYARATTSPRSWVRPVTTQRRSCMPSPVARVQEADLFSTFCLLRRCTSQVLQPGLDIPEPSQGSTGLYLHTFVYERRRAPHTAAEHPGGVTSCTSAPPAASASATGWSPRTSAPPWHATAPRSRRTCARASGCRRMSNATSGRMSDASGSMRTASERYPGAVRKLDSNGDAPGKPVNGCSL